MEGRLRPCSLLDTVRSDTAVAWRVEIFLSFPRGGKVRLFSFLFFPSFGDRNSAWGFFLSFFSLLHVEAQMHDGKGDVNPCRKREKKRENPAAAATEEYDDFF